MTKVPISLAIVIGAVNCIPLWAVCLWRWLHTRVCFLRRATHIEWLITDRNTEDQPLCPSIWRIIQMERPTFPFPESFFPQYSNCFPQACSTNLHIISKTLQDGNPRLERATGHQLSEVVFWVPVITASISSASIQKNNIIWSLKYSVLISYLEFKQEQTI